MANPPTPLSRKGLTLLEILVVIVIVLIGLGLALSLISRLREDASQVHCANNLRLIGRGIHHFQAKLPKGFVQPLGPRFPLPASRIDDGYATWAVQLAPYLTNRGPLLEWDLQRPYADQLPAAREAVLPQFFCPARPRSSLLSVTGDFDKPGAVGDYACAAGDGDPRFPWDSDIGNGAMLPAKVVRREGKLILSWESRTEASSLKRGLSNTILIGDKHVPLGKFGEAAVGDSSPYNGTNWASFARAGGPGFGLAPSPADAFNDNFGSCHPGFCQFLMADDSVRPIANRVDENILGQLIRRE